MRGRVGHAGWARAMGVPAPDHPQLVRKALGTFYGPKSPFMSIQCTQGHGSIRAFWASLERGARGPLVSLGAGLQAGHPGSKATSRSQAFPQIQVPLFNSSTLAGRAGGHFQNARMKGSDGTHQGTSPSFPRAPEPASCWQSQARFFPRRFQP